MALADIIAIVTYIVAFILGLIAKRIPFVNNKIIPLQNIAVGLIIAIIEWIITKDFNIAIATSGILAGGTYDVLHNLDKLRKEDK